ncbi:hypothetical protein Cci01nite_38530 [Catellatospora citrea]|uniref:Bacterial transcriptional activator domain-containing protein n=2 Tax=Catellatospora citrea TaxID=53366 RepID=A0A8J3KDS7_9ACTN|nr:hypothetical protein Cci01nite_38530 [Catellatospora citrea]
MSVTGLLVMLAGLPAALAIVAGWPLPDAWPTGQQWLAWLERPVTVPFMIGLFACVGWLLWAGLLLAVLAEILSMVGRVDTSRWRLPAALRAVAAGLVGAVVLAITGSAARAAAPPAAASTVAGMTGPAASAAAGPRTAVESVPPASAATTTKVHHGKITFEVRGQRYHAIVNRGDTMSKIAQQWLGDADRWPEICRLNWHRHWPKIGGKLRDCDLIYPRWDLRLPADATPPPGALRIGTPPRTTPPPQQTAPPQPSPQPTVTAPADPDGVIEPESATTNPPATSDQNPHTDASHQPAPGAGVTLPGGWVSAALAAAILAAVTATWAVRRQRYRPRQPISLRHPDPWWPPLPDIVRRLRTALHHRDRPDRDDIDDLTPVQQPPTQTGQNLAQPAPATPQNEVHDNHPNEHDHKPTPALAADTTATGPQLAGLGTLPSNGLVLHGPGAHAAARGLIAATITATQQMPGDLITTGSTAMALLGDSGPAHPRLTVAATTAEAIEHVTRQILARTRHTHDLHQPPSLPATVLLLDSTEGHDKVLDALLPVAAASNIGAVLLDSHPAAEAITVNDDGTTSRGTRLATLDTDSTRQLLDITNPPAGDQPPPHLPAAATEPHPTPPADQALNRTQIKIIGAPRILDQHGRPITGLRAAAIQTMVLLAVEGTHVAKTDLWELLFPDATMRRAEERFAVTIADLRNGFRRASGDTTRNAVPNPGGRYRLDPHLVDVDLWQFNTHLDAAARTTDPETRQRHLRQALDLHTGPLADGTDYDWIEPHQHAFASKVIDTLVALAEIVSGHTEAAELLDRACVLAPANPAVFGQAVKTWQRAERPDRISAAVGRYLDALKELELEVDQDTASLIRVVAAEIRTVT